MIHQVSDGYVKVETHQGVTTIEFFHPQGNSLPSKILEDLAQEIHSAGISQETRSIVLRSGGDGAFCSGASLHEVAAIKTSKQGAEFFTGFANVLNAMRKCPKLIVGRVQGRCVGGGVGLAAAVDYCIACEKAEVKLSELSMGFGPLIVGPAVERKIGLSAFSQLAIDATMWRNSEWAKRKGLFAEVHPSVEGMDESVFRLSNALAHVHPEAMAETKKVFWKDTEHWDTLLAERATINGKLALSEHTKNALQKFLARQQQS
ncbi:MAG: enoyl-CoA hydratase/isomerase family protein [Williamsia sp.]|nr:enoyl-CoA hydratase/isomerase family protein [Williamsia sp.]